MPARFHEQGISSQLKNRRALSHFLDALVRGYLPEVKKISLTYIFCTDEHLLQMNRQFLSHDTLTDIITFDLSKNEQELQGEIYISAERVTENAGIFKTTYSRELHRVIFHGALHLCGFGDKKKTERQAMRAAEDACLKAYLPEA